MNPIDITSFVYSATGVVYVSFIPLMLTLLMLWAFVKVIKGIVRSARS